MCSKSYSHYLNEPYYSSAYFEKKKYEMIGPTTMSLKTQQNWSTVVEDSLIYLSTQERSIFFGVYLVIYIIAVIGNIAAIVITARGQHRHIQKTYVISLALSDFIAATAIAVMSLTMFSQRLIVWTLGSFMCSFLPSVPVFGVVCSSAALVGIALDRYRSVVHALKKRWNPEMWVCILSIILIWIVSIGIAYPMFTFFKTFPVRLACFDYENNKIYYEETYMCLTSKKEELQIYYISLICMVFIPLFFLFTWLYYKIAQLIWKHRKPLSHMFHKKYETSTTIETSTSQIKPSEECSRTTTNSDVSLAPVIKSKNARVKRKVRTFKIIVFLIIIFIILRLPVWLFDTVKLSVNIGNHTMWLSKYICTAFTLFHCALNPFLYTFLNKTLDTCSRIYKALKEFVCEVCCCCFSNTEFEEFENENPFIREQFENRINNGTDSAISNKANPKNSKVKFEELPVVKLYNPEVNSSSESYKEFKKY